MPLNLQKRVAAGLVAGNLDHVKASREQLLGASEYFPLLCLIAEALDDAISGRNTYVVLGTTKTLSALSLSLNQPPASQPWYGVSLVDLAADIDSTFAYSEPEPF